MKGQQTGTTGEHWQQRIYGHNSGIYIKKKAFLPIIEFISSYTESRLSQGMYAHSGMVQLIKFCFYLFGTVSRDFAINGTETYSSDLEAFMANPQLTIASGGKTVTLELTRTSLHCKYHGERSSFPYLPKTTI
jgi:hypothetical protein